MTRGKSLLNVVSIGGGTGLACLLKGLKHRVLDLPVLVAPAHKPWISRLTAVVTVTDDGGSSGRLRDELQVLPPGDIRSCLVALSTDESLLSQLFQYRFPDTTGLQGHSFGNLFLSALTSVTGDFLQALQVSSEVLATRGRIYPSTLQDVRLQALVEGGARVQGESAISRCTSRILRVSLSPRGCRPVPAVVDAIRTADIITLGPGSLFTSVLPNLLVRGISAEIRKSRALKVYITNLMTQPGETTGFNTLDHVRALLDHGGDGLIDGLIMNRTPFDDSVVARYRAQKSEPVSGDRKTLRQLGLALYEGALLAHGNVIRHDPDRLAAAVHTAYERWRSSPDQRKLRAAI